MPTDPVAAISAAHQRSASVIDKAVALDTHWPSVLRELERLREVEAAAKEYITAIGKGMLGVPANRLAEALGTQAEGEPQ